jgi:polyribonucleotide nucleotidyltransferase
MRLAHIYLVGNEKESKNMTMFNVSKKEMTWGGRKLVLETGKIARQAAGSVIATYGKTVVHAAVTAKKEIAEGQDFFPLTVHYQEKAYSAGKIPGGFIKRESRPSEKEVLVSRLIDRPIRPLFPSAFKNEVQVVCTVISHDLENDADIVAMIAASAALSISGVPFLGPIAGAKVAYKEGQYILNPTKAELQGTELELVVAGTKEGVLMVESEAKELSEKVMLDAVMFGYDNFQEVISLIEELKEEAGKEAWEAPEYPTEFFNLKERILNDFGAKIDDAFKTKEKDERYSKLDTIKADILASIDENNEVELAYLDEAFKKAESHIVREAVLTTGVRIDGRDTKTVRNIECDVNLLPKAHGSALFTRGETQSLAVTTLGTGQDEQIVDAIDGEYKQNFMLHYNFPPYSVGECGRLGAPGRREIGHGKLAWRALNAVLPSKEKFPYSIRLVSEIMESNGSSSMASVCGGSMSLMDAGVPLSAPVAGIAMGLIKEEDGRFSVLSDILGDEDHLGDMDFKVAGTENGVTALQMDIKITSITKEIMETALEQAHDGRKHILGEMAKAISVSRDSVNDNAPRIIAIKIPVDKIRDVIGSGGKVIKEITETTNTKIDISDDGIIKIASMKKEEGEKALNWISNLVATPEVGVVYNGVVTKITDFGAFVRFLGTTEGLVHISEIKPERIEKVTDVLKEGEKLFVKCIGIDNRGKVKLSAKRVNQENGEDLENQVEEAAEENSAE